MADRTVIDASDLEGETFVSLSHHDGMRERVDSIFQNLRINRNMLVETEFFATICCMVINDIGVSVVNPLVELLVVRSGESGTP